ncbi:hypothetical protein EIP86_007324 [Pleurotus ostreatoroseus]|nr:hypothetical protein EIP86_007324 [Pleurotus ostreatoroseus]
MSKYPREKTARFVVLNADAESSQAVGSSHSQSGPTPVDQAHMHTEGAEDGPPPPSYDESIATYGGPMPTKPVDEKRAIRYMLQHTVVTDETPGAGSSFTNVEPIVSSFPFPIAQINGGYGGYGPGKDCIEVAMSLPISMPVAQTGYHATNPFLSAQATSSSTFYDPLPSPYERDANPVRSPAPPARVAASSPNSTHETPTQANSMEDRTLRSRTPTKSSSPRASSVQRKRSVSTPRSSELRLPLSGSDAIASKTALTSQSSVASSDSLVKNTKALAPYSNPPSGPMTPSLDRLAPKDLGDISFSPCALFSLSEHLEDGFPVLPPPANLEPHPFATHDVNAMDWTEFLADIKTAASLTSMDKVLSNIGPTAIGIGTFGTGTFISKALCAQMKKRKIAAAVAIVDQWNYNFFHPRRMDIVLARGQERYSGVDHGSLPDLAAANGQTAYLARAKSVEYSTGSLSDEDFDSDDDEGDDTTLSRTWGNSLREKRQERKDARKARKAEKRVQKTERRAQGTGDGSPTRQADEETLWRLEKRQLMLENVLALTTAKTL